MVGDADAVLEADGLGTTLLDAEAEGDTLAVADADGTTPHTQNFCPPGSLRMLQPAHSSPYPHENAPVAPSTLLRHQSANQSVNVHAKPATYDTCSTFVPANTPAGSRPNGTSPRCLQADGCKSAIMTPCTTCTPTAYTDRSAVIPMKASRDMLTSLFPCKPLSSTTNPIRERNTATAATDVQALNGSQTRQCTARQRFDIVPSQCAVFTSKRR